MIEAGGAVVDITPGVGIGMGGYGARQGVSTGIHDNLFVRTAVLADGDTTVVVAVCDLVGVSTDLVDAARALIEEECGIPAANVCISATHTHSGPGGIRNREAADYVAVTARKIAGAVRVATSARQPVTLKANSFDVTTTAQNRRHPDGPVDAIGQVLVADPGDGRAPAFTLVQHACHATVLEHDNLLYSADFPGAACRAVEGALGGPCVYVQGTCGDLNPVWMRHDFAEVDRVGGIVGSAATRAAHEMRPLGEGQWGINLSWSEDVEQPGKGTLLSGVALRAASERVALPRRPVPDRAELDSRLRHAEQQIKALAPDDVTGRRRLLPEVNALRMVRVRARLDEPGTRADEEVELQAFRIADQCALVALPGEFFVETGQSIRAAIGVDHLIVAGYANGYFGYVPPAHEYDKHGYEAGATRFQPEAEAIVVGEAIRLVKEVLDG